jgi:hypothetical protein
MRAERVMCGCPQAAQREIFTAKVTIVFVHSWSLKVQDFVVFSGVFFIGLWE